MITAEIIGSVTAAQEVITVITVKDICVITTLEVVVIRAAA